MKKPRLSAPLVFGLTAFALILVLTLAWSKVSPWTSYPVALLSKVALEQGAPIWVRKVEASPGKMVVQTRISMPDRDAAGRLADVEIESDPGRYAYGLPVFLALLIAARDRHRWARGIAGYLLLLPAQAFSATLFILMQMVLFTKVDMRLLQIDSLQLNAIVYGFQLGSLVVPTLVPVGLWLWLDREFFRDVILRGWKVDAVANNAAIAAAEAAAQEAARLEVIARAQEAAARAAEQHDPAGRAQAAVSASASAALPSRK